MNEIITEIINKNLKHKKQNAKMKIAEKLKNFNQKKGEKCEECGNFLFFNDLEHIDTKEKTTILKRANFCKIKWCSHCASKKAKKVFAENLSIFKQIENEKKVAYIFLTLTIKNLPLDKLREACKEMSIAFQKFIQYKAFKRAVKGYFRGFEFMGDNTKAGEAHPHYHIILIVDKYYFKNKDYIKHSEWQEMWRKALKADYTPMVNIKKITENKNKKKGGKKSIPLYEAVAETGKYSIAPSTISQMSKNNFETLDRETHKIRQYNRGGIMKQYKPDIEKLNEEEWKVIDEYCFTYFKQSKKYFNTSNKTLNLKGL